MNEARNRLGTCAAGAVTGSEDRKSGVITVALHRFVRRWLRGPPWYGFLSEFPWYRQALGGRWERWIMDQPIGGQWWFRTEGMRRPHQLCRGTPVVEEWPNS